MFESCLIYKLNQILNRMCVGVSASCIRTNIRVLVPQGRWNCACRGLLPISPRGHAASSEPGDSNFRGVGKLTCARDGNRM